MLTEKWSSARQHKLSGESFLFFPLALPYCFCHDLIKFHVEIHVGITSKGFWKLISNYISQLIKVLKLDRSMDFHIHKLIGCPWLASVIDSGARVCPSHPFRKHGRFDFFRPSDACYITRIQTSYTNPPKIKRMHSCCTFFTFLLTWHDILLGMTT